MSFRKQAIWPKKQILEAQVDGKCGFCSDFLWLWDLWDAMCFVISEIFASPFLFRSFSASRDSCLCNTSLTLPAADTSMPHSSLALYGDAHIITNPLSIFLPSSPYFARTLQQMPHDHQNPIIQFRNEIQTFTPANLSENIVIFFLRWGKRTHKQRMLIFSSLHPPG